MKIVLGSGGARGVIALGAVDELQRQGFFDEATEFAGVSIGSVLAAGLVLGVCPRKMLRTAVRWPMEPDLRPANFGLDRGKGLVKFIQRMLCLKKRITLGELHAQTKKTLVICVCNVSDRVPEYWSHKTHPDMSLVKALRISCSIPFIFGSVRHQGKLYVDGAWADALPMQGDKDVLAIGFCNDQEGTIETLQDFVEALRTVRPPKNPRLHLQLDPGAINVFAFDLSPDQLQEAYDSGKEQASRWAKKNV